MYRHIKSYEIKYTDVDAFDRLKLSSLLSFLQESACLSADELGFGYDALTPKHIGFIIVNWYIEFKEQIKLGDELTVHTWPLPPRHLTFFRDFEFYVGDKKVGVGTTRWCMINTDDYTMLPTSAFFKEGDFDDYNTERSVVFNGWKIPRIDCGEKVYARTIKFSDYDHYFHVNNTKYADFMFDVFSVDELRGKKLNSVQITYVKQCKEGEEITFVRETKDGFYLVEGKVDGELRVQMRVEFNDV